MSDLLQRHFALYEPGPNGWPLLHAMPLLLGALCISGHRLSLLQRLPGRQGRRARRRPDDARPPLQRRPELSPDQQMGAVRPSLRGHLRRGPAHRAGAGHSIWLHAGTALAGHRRLPGRGVQDMLVLAASVRRDGKSLAEIARAELGPWAYTVASVAILFIVVIALAGLGFVVVKALGGEEVALGENMAVRFAGE